MIIATLSGSAWLLFYTWHEIWVIFGGAFLSWVGFYVFGILYDWWYTTALRYTNMKVSVQHFEYEVVPGKWQARIHRGWRLTAPMFFTVDGVHYEIKTGAFCNGRLIPHIFKGYDNPEKHLQSTFVQ